MKSPHHFALDHRSYGSKFNQLCMFIVTPIVAITLFPYQYGESPELDFVSFALVGAFVAFQWMLFMVVPGEIKFGGVMHSGQQYFYKLNSFTCILINGMAWITAHLLNLWPGDFVRANIAKFLLPIMIWGYVFSICAFIKGCWWPTNSDSVPHGDFVVDFISGIEITPRLSQKSPLDLKLFLIGHVGMTLWLLLNLNFVFYSYHQQHNLFATVVLFLLQAVYIFDWAYYEEWYLHTIDIKQDRLGWTLAYCPLNAIPSFYVSHCWFSSSSHSPEFNFTWTCCWAVAYTGFYLLFRKCNNQKDEFRQTQGKLRFCGQRLTGIKATYTGEDGVLHHTLLLASGLWGQSRHFNYFADLCMCLCLSLIVLGSPTCVVDAFVPHTYTLLMTYILLARQMRDDVKCAQKYGDSWKEYCKRVPYKIVPFIY